jgi:hypothetical protein
MKAASPLNFLKGQFTACVRPGNHPGRRRGPANRLVARAFRFTRSKQPPSRNSETEAGIPAPREFGSKLSQAECGARAQSPRQAWCCPDAGECAKITHFQGLSEKGHKRRAEIEHDPWKLADRQIGISRNAADGLRDLNAMLEPMTTKMETFEGRNRCLDFGQSCDRFCQIRKIGPCMTRLKIPWINNRSQRFSRSDHRVLEP